MAKELGMHRMAHSSRKCPSWVPLCSLLASAMGKARVFFSSSPCGGGNAKWEKKWTKIHFQDRDTEVVNDQVTCQRSNNFFYVDMKPAVIVVQSLSRVQLFETPWTAAQQALPFSTISQSLLKFMSIESVMPSNHLILCRPPSLLPSIFPSIRVFSNESVLHITWPKYWSFSFSISPSKGYSGLISFRIDWFDLLAVQRTFKVQKHQFFSAQLSLWSTSHIHRWLLKKL